MTDQYLTSILEEVERIAKQHNQVAQFTDHPEHEYLRYAVLRLLEGETDEMSVNVPQIDGVTVGYGEDEAMFESWSDDIEWWETVPPQEEFTRFGCSTPTSTSLEEHNLLAAEETLQRIYDTISDKPEKMVKYENAPRPDDA